MVKVTRTVSGIVQTDEVHEKIWKDRLQPWQRQGWVEVAAEAPVEAKVKKSDTKTNSANSTKAKGKKSAEVEATLEDDSQNEQSEE